MIPRLAALPAPLRASSPLLARLPCPSLRRASSSSPSNPPRPPVAPTKPRPLPATSPSHLTPSEASSKATETSLLPPSPALPLARALGIPNPPTTRKLTTAEWRASLLDQNSRMVERKHLVKQIASGYFKDYHELRKEGGKGWIAPGTLIREDLSLYFPNIEGIALSTKLKTHTTNLFPGKISLVSMTSFKSSEEHVNSFVRPTLADMDSSPLFQYVQINVQENPLRSFLVSLFISSLRGSVPEKYHRTYLLSDQSLEYLREPMGMGNKHVGYVFLVDEKGKIRWAGCSWATAEEEEGLRKCCTVLVKRLESERAH